MKSFAQSLFDPAYLFLEKLWNWLTIPSDAVIEVGSRRQAQFSAAMALFMLVILSLQASVALTTGRVELAITLALLWIGVLLAYGLSRSPTPQWSPVILVYGFTLFAFILTGRGVSDVATTLYGMIPIAYLLAGVLLSIGWQIALVTLVLAGSVILGTMQTALGVNMNMLGGNLIALGVVLILTSKLRDGIERRRLDQVRQINRELETTQTDLKKERTLLRNSEARTRALLTAVPDMIFELSRDGIFLDFVPAPTLRPILPPEHFLGRSVTEVMPPEIAATTMQAVQQALVSSQLQTFEYQLPSDNTLRYFEARMVASRPNAVLAIVRDITERKQAEEALRESESRFRSFVEEITDGIMFFDSQGRVLEWNSAMERITGLERQQALGMQVWDVEMKYTPDEEKKDLDLEQLKLRFHQIFETGNLPTRFQVGIETGIQHMDGSRRVAEQRLFLLKSVQGFAMGVVIHDITERKQAEAERETLIKDLEARNAELERFTYTVSHDLKSPLVTINGFLGFLEKDVISGDMNRYKADSQRIQEAVHKMHLLLGDLLELSRIGRMLNAPETIPFADLVRDAMDNVHGQLESRGITVTLQPNLPAVHGDRQRLVEVLQNLLDNAAKFMGDQPDPRIEIGQRGEDAERGKPVFYLKDNGIGIAPEYHERVFGLFNQLDPKMGGTGVGLALVKRIVEFHGGRIWVESEAGKGATFFFTLGREDKN